MLGTVFTQVLVLITTAVGLSVLFRRFQIPSTVTYLSVGLLVNPSALGWVANDASLHVIAEFGVVFLLFSLGLEFSLAKMIALRKTVFGLGSLQVVFCASLIFLAAWLSGATQKEAFVIAGALALSSTAVVSKELVRRNEITQPHGIASIGILLFQDLAAVLFLIIVPKLDGQLESGLVWVIGLTLIKGATLFALLLAAGKWLLPPLFHEIARARSEEIFVLTVLMVSLLAAALTHSFGLSMALGAFIAGMMLSETHYKHQIEADIRPFRDLLLGLFFISVGMIVDVDILLKQWLWVLLASVALLLFKSLAIFALVYRRQRDPAVAIKTGLYLAQGGEFGFALFAMAAQHHLLGATTGAILIATVVVSIASTPLLMNLARHLANRMTPKPEQQPVAVLEVLESASSDLRGHAIICGFGRVGQTVARFLRKNHFSFIAIDSDPVQVLEASRAGEPVFYGDSTRMDILEALGLERARLLVVTYNDTEKSLKSVRAIRSLQHPIPILVRTTDDRDLDTLKVAGATEVVPEILEASLMMVSHVLTLMGANSETVFRTISAARRDRYQLLHGYYYGLQSRLVDEEGNPVELLHAVHLPENAYACGKSLAELNLDQCGVTLAAVKRGEDNLERPPPDFVLASGDTLVLLGKPNQMEHAEVRALGG